MPVLDHCVFTNFEKKSRNFIMNTEINELRIIIRLKKS